jgi:hypothetical protein
MLVSEVGDRAPKPAKENVCEADDVKVAQRFIAGEKSTGSS